MVPAQVRLALQPGSVAPSHHSRSRQFATRVLISFEEQSRRASFIDDNGHKDLKEKTLRKFSDVLVTLSEIMQEMVPYVDGDNVPDCSCFRLCVSNKITEVVLVSCT